MPDYKTVLVASSVSPGGRARYVLSVAPGWHVTVATGAAAPSPEDVQEVLNVCFPRWAIRYPGQPNLRP